jgi:hypothetical protein
MKADHIILALKPFEGWAVEMEYTGVNGASLYTPFPWNRYYSIVTVRYLPPSKRSPQMHDCDIILWSGHTNRVIGVPSGLCLPSRRTVAVSDGTTITLRGDNMTLTISKAVPIEDWVSRPYWLEGYNKAGTQ